MASTYGVRELYGGAMIVELPVELIDSSDIRQIPDHQEVFLSPTTLTSIIFEINTYVGPSATNPSLPSNQNPTTSTSTSTNADGTTTTTTTSVTTAVVSNGVASTTGASRAQPELDAEVAKYHFTDVISPPDTLASPLPNPQPVKMVDPSLAQYPAYMLAGNINSVDPSRRSQNQQRQQPVTALPSVPTIGSSASHQHQNLSSLIHQIQLLIRLPSHQADLVVRVNVPLKEFVQVGQAMVSSDSGATEAMIAEELGHARDMLARVVGTLGVRNWGLFGA